MIKKVDIFSLELTNICNLDCDFCADRFITRKKGSMDVALAKRLIKEVKDTKFCEEVTTNVMGEPLIYKDLFTLLKYANDINQNISIITNGERLDEKIAERLIENPPATVGISYHCNDEKSFSYQHPSISYEEYKRRILNFIELKFKQKIKTNIFINLMSTINMPSDQFSILDNMNDIAQTSKSWIDFGKLMKKKYNISWPTPDILYDGTNMLLPGLWVTLKPRYHSWAGKILPSGVKVIPATKFYCSDPFTQYNVLWNGDLTLCCVDYNGDLVYGNISNKGILETFNSDKVVKIRNNILESKNIPEKCSICKGKLVNFDNTDYNPPKFFPRQSLSYNFKRRFFLAIRLMYQYPDIKVLFNRIFMRAKTGKLIQRKYFKFK